MAPSSVRFALVGVFALLVLAFAVSPSEAQPGRRGTVYSYSCGKCGKDLGTSTSPLGPPGRPVCPRCGVFLSGTKDVSAPRTPTADTGSFVILGVLGIGALLFFGFIGVLIYVLIKVTSKAPRVESRSARRRRFE